MTQHSDEKLFRLLVHNVEDYAIFAMDTQGCVISWNLGAERLKGYSSDEIIGKHFSKFYPEDQIQKEHPAFELEQALKAGSYKEEGWRVKKDGSLFWASVLITPLYNDERKHIGFANITRDLSEHVKATTERILLAEALHESEEAFAQIVSAVKDYAIFALDPTGRVLTWNEGAQRIKGYKKHEIVGQHFSIFYTTDAKITNHPAYELDQARKHGSYEEEGWRVKKDGSMFWAGVTITSVAGTKAGFLKVTRDLSERKRYEAQLEESRDLAIATSKWKSQFVANVTHELRTPLSSLVGLSEVLCQDLDSDENLHATAVNMFEASKVLLNMVNELLDFAKLESGKMQVENNPYSIKTLLRDIDGLVRLKAEQKGLIFSITLSNDLPDLVIGDQAKVRQILLNFVNNAVKFTDAGAIEIAAKVKNGHLLLSVTDTGIGISPVDKDKLFSPFIQGSQASSRLYGGTGLGLAIVNQYVQLMGGEIGVSSLPGQGSTFWVAIPTGIDSENSADG